MGEEDSMESVSDTKPRETITDTALANSVSAVRQDPRDVTAAVTERVNRFFGTDNVAMMGGWT
jgi:hypothetical protein